MASNRKVTIEDCFSYNVKEMFLDYGIPEEVFEAKIAIPYKGGHLAIGTFEPCVGCVHYRFLATKDTRPADTAHYCTNKDVAEHMISLSKLSARRTEKFSPEQKVLFAMPSASNYTN